MYEQARKAIWEAVNPHTGRKRIDEAFPKALRARTDSQSMTIEFKSGSIWRVVGSDNPSSLVGAPPAGIVFSEWALANPSAWADPDRERRLGRLHHHAQRPQPRQGHAGHGA
jgi:hypothetical protein